MGLNILFYKFSNEGIIDESIPIEKVQDFITEDVKTVEKTLEMINIEQMEIDFGGESVGIHGHEDNVYVVMERATNGEEEDVEVTSDYIFNKTYTFPLVEEIGDFRKGYNFLENDGSNDDELVLTKSEETENIMEYIENNIPESNVISMDYLINTLFANWEELHSYIKENDLKENTDFVYVSY